ncbi:MAG: carbohydrate binding domain-containing protein [Patescibacteria group bacterium]|nr:carbohydrate binding domain-containing protein [Patescibacteria group bacterium]
MMNTFAYDVANWLASGGKGEGAMFFNEGWSEYLKNIGDAALGSFVEETIQEAWGVSICNPSNLSLKLSLGFAVSSRRPQQPDCSVTDMVKNWNQLIDDPNFLDRFTPIFDPNHNDIGISLRVFNYADEIKASEIIAATEERREGKGFKGVTEAISKWIKTPASMVAEQAFGITGAKLDTSADHVQWGPTFVGLALGAADTFLNTLIGKLFQRLFQEGLSSSSSSDDNNELLGFLSGLSFDRQTAQNQDLYSGDTGVDLYSGAKAAQLRFIDFFEAGKTKSQPYDILTKLSFCSDPKNPGPDECVITQPFRTAIGKELTLKEAIRQGFVNGDAPFGFYDYDASAIYRGIPYRSIVILRSYRVVPVGWELAAQAIREFKNGAEISLNNLIASYEDKSSIFYGLVDPNWVLKSPEHICTANGYGSKIIFEDRIGGLDANGDGDYTDNDDQPPELTVGRAEYCADYQSCIEYNFDGTCKYYGYCSEERSVWNLDASGCPDYYNTCTTFRSSSGQVASYLANSLDYNGCNIDNAGCQWYCQDYNSINDIWTCTNEGQRVLKPCTQAGGCNLSVSCNVASGQTSCIDTTSGISLTISNTCNSGSRWWDGSQCAVAESCIVEPGGVECQTSSCDVLSSRLTNGDFELGPSDGRLPQDWTGDNAYFEKAGGSGEKVKSGASSLRFFSYGGSIRKVASSSLQSLGTGTFTFSAYLYNNLNVGDITFRISGTNVTTNSFTINDTDSGLLKNQWQLIDFDFTTTADTTDLKVEVILGDGVSASGQVSGIAWFDNFKITESCVADAVTLRLIGTIDKDQSKIHLDRDAKSCSQSDAGCSEFIRTIPNFGTNVVVNSSFENWPDQNQVPPGWQGGEQWSGSGNSFARSQDAYDGSYSLQLTSNDNKARDWESMLLPGLKPNTTYRISFWAKSDSETGDWYTEFQYTNPDEASIQDYLHILFNGERLLSLNTQWRQFVSDPMTLPQFTDFKFAVLNLTNSPRVIYIDAVQIEEVSVAQPTSSSYREYGAVNQVYLKKAPDHLGCDRLDGDLPSECYDYALYCTKDEVGCEAYTPLAGGQTITGVTQVDDYCPAECVGYQAFKQAANIFEDQETLEFFIPTNEISCSAADAGCSEFTNLDEVAQGGEGRYYFKYLRQCIKPQDAAASCTNFFNWQGSDQTGYQLRVYSLQTTGGAPEEVLTDPSQWPERWGDAQDCDGPEDIEVNPFCKEMYDSAGNVHYVIFENTISCTDDCFQYRKSRLGDPDEVAIDNCTNSNGTWDSASNACVYSAIPSQGISCSAQAAGCREYRGNTGANVYTLFSDNFEDGDDKGWRFGAVSSEALSVSGHSLENQYTENPLDNKFELIQTAFGRLRVGINNVVCDPANLPECLDANSTTCYNRELDRCVGVDAVDSNYTCLVEPGESYCGELANLLNANSSYIISFWAKAKGSNSIQDVEVRLAGVNSGANDYYTVSKVTLGPDWNYYILGPITFDDILPNANLMIFKDVASDTTANDFVVDNIIVKEVFNNAYVIKHQDWNVPNSCDTNPWPASGAITAPQFMLGCSAYRDSYNRTHNLKSFSSLCRDQAVGCEALIDTHNSASAFAETFNESDTVTSPVAASYQVTVPADNLIYLVNRAKYQCSSMFEGCQAVGLPQIDYSGTEPTVSGYQTIYLVNNPDQYSQTLCQHGEVGCQEYQSSDGYTYFKDPRSRTCEYRLIPNQTNYGWFRTGSTSQTPDCPVVDSPVGQVHPGRDSFGNTFTGLCPGEFNTCTQFIDPVTNFGKNLLLNPDFRLHLAVPGDSNKPDSWYESALDTGGQQALRQLVTLQRDTLYTLDFVGKQNLNTADGQRLAIGLEECFGLSSYDQSMIAQSGNKFYLPNAAYSQDQRGGAVSINGFPTSGVQYSGRFYSSIDQACFVVLRSTTPTSLNIPGILSLVDNVSLHKTGVYYALENTVDKYSCNGVVDERNNCILFNDRSQVNYKIGETDNSYLNFDADMSGPTVNNGLPVFQCGGDGRCDANVVLKARPDRVCDTWLNCESYLTKVDQNGGEVKECLNLGLCTSLDETGACDQVVVKNLGNDRRDYYQDIDQIRNLSGYARPGFDFTSAGERIIRGYYPFAEMTQEGSSAEVGNGDFASKFGNSSQPLGWNVYEDEDTLGWRRSKFNIESDVTLSLEGSYLKINGPYQTISEEIDVEKGVNYILSGWVNSFNLKHTGSQATQAQICISNGIDVACPPELAVASGLNWQHLTYEFPVFTDKISIVLRNASPDVDLCRDGDQTTPCGLVGYSLFDQISIKPVLKVRSNSLIESDFIARTCRLYPQVDSLACSYIKDSVFYNGQHGYCLTKDPQNPEQCIQWWPVGRILGEETTDDRFVFTVQSPLYYCTEKRAKEVFANDALLANYPTDSFYKSFVDELGYDTQFVPFDIDEDYRMIFRYPYIQKFKLEAIHKDKLPGFQILAADSLIAGRIYRGEGDTDLNLSYNGSEGKIFLPYSVRVGLPMEFAVALLAGEHVAEIVQLASIPIVDVVLAYDVASFTFYDIRAWNGYDKDTIKEALTDQETMALWSNVGEFLSGILSGVIGFELGGGDNFVSDLIPAFFTATGNRGSDGEDAEQAVIETDFGPITAVNIATEQNQTYKLNLGDPVPDLLMDIYGAAFVVLTSREQQFDEGSDQQGPNIVLKITTDELTADYCSELVQVVTSSGTNKAWTSRVTEGSKFVLEESGVTNIYDLEGRVIRSGEPISRSGHYLYYDPFDYDKWLKAVKVAGGDIYSAGFTYQSSDYEPFGSVVPPGDGQFPEDWTSRTDVAARQPLFYEPPLTSIGAPYQARMGELHSQDSLKHVFLKSYGVWEWDEGDVDVGSDNGYKLVPGQSWDLFAVWNGDPNGGYCPPGGRPDNQTSNALCRTRPIVDPNNIFVNKQKSVTLKTVGTVKLDFTVDVDPNQLPVVFYDIDWGDGNHTTVSGVSLNDRPNPDNPFTVYHVYDYWEMQRNKGSVGALTCDDTSCVTSIGIKVRDNWNAITQDAGNPYDTEYVQLNNAITVEKN